MHIYFFCRNISKPTSTLGEEIGNKEDEEAPYALNEQGDEQSKSDEGSRSKSKAIQNEAGQNECDESRTTNITSLMRRVKDFLVIKNKTNQNN